MKPYINLPYFWPKFENVKCKKKFCLPYYSAKFLKKGLTLYSDVCFFLSVVKTRVHLLAKQTKSFFSQQKEKCLNNICLSTAYHRSGRSLKNVVVVRTAVEVKIIIVNYFFLIIVDNTLMRAMSYPYFTLFAVNNCNIKGRNLKLRRPRVKLALSYCLAYNVVLL